MARAPLPPRSSPAARVSLTYGDILRSDILRSVDGVLADLLAVETELRKLEGLQSTARKAATHFEGSCRLFAEKDATDDNDHEHAFVLRVKENVSASTLRKMVSNAQRRQKELEALAHVVAKGSAAAQKRLDGVESEVSTWSVEALEDFLGGFNKKTTGNKAELVDRVALHILLFGAGTRDITTTPLFIWEGMRVEVQWSIGLDKGKKWFGATVAGVKVGNHREIEYDPCPERPFLARSRDVYFGKDFLFDYPREEVHEWRIVWLFKPAHVNAGAAGTSPGAELAAFRGKLTENVCAAVSMLPDMTARQRQAVCEELVKWGADCRADVHELLDDTAGLTAVSEAAESAGVKRITWIKLKKACAEGAVLLT